ncbi:hypothetical protein BJ878DRAFT_550029 [Calycina marina]|uniref:Uncharacterized protein n=1 Tax=Calycina marina TaxID=1763456 RepID=A0A9P7Z499_9HELO|nr:hypothetical protein BJ878DRAFT_550029 [Calycina marina]
MPINPKQMTSFGHTISFSRTFAFADSHMEMRLKSIPFLRRVNCHIRLVVIRRAAADTDPTIFDIYTSLEIVTFLGTPHRGSSKAGIAETVRKIVSVSGFDTTDKNIRALQVNSTELELIHELFMKLYEQKDRQFKVLTFQEAKGISGISYLKLNERVVEPFSPSLTGTEPTQTINANHMSMCRFTSIYDDGYKQVLGEILILVSEKERKLQLALEGAGIANMKTGTSSRVTSPSVAHSLTDMERKCIALLMQNTSSAAEYKSSLPHRVEGTCQWILSNSHYRDWNSQTRNCLLGSAVILEPERPFSRPIL